jgi:hypothetical protein
MATLPTFGTLRTNFPYKSTAAGPAGALIKGNKDLVQLIGGKLEKSLKAVYPDLDAMNTCAVRLSYCLNKAGFKIGSVKGVRIYQGADGLNYTISADEMISYMKVQFGSPVKVWDGRKADGKRWLGGVKLPAQGLFGYDWQGRIADFGATGHVDIGKVTDSGSGPLVSEFGTGAYLEAGAMIVYFWECSL